MRPLDEIISSGRVQVHEHNEFGGNGYMYLDPKKPSHTAQVVWSINGGWDHVSVSWRNRMPTWDEMCTVKNTFFLPEETCVEYHPAEANYINFHPYCLHIWRCQSQDFPIPPEWMIGPKEGQTLSDAIREAENSLGV